jgi:hypothetical protein
MSSVTYTITIFGGCIGGQRSERRFDRRIRVRRSPRRAQSIVVDDSSNYAKGQTAIDVAGRMLSSIF